MVQGHSVGRSVAGGLERSPARHTERAEAGTVNPRCGPDLAQEFHRRAFAIRTGNSDDMARLARIEAGCHRCQFSRCVIGDDHRHIKAWNVPVGQNGHRTLRDRLGRKGAAMQFHTRQGGKQKAGLHGPANAARSL